MPMRDFTESNAMNEPVPDYRESSLTKDEANKETDQTHPEAEARTTGVFANFLIHQLLSAFSRKAPASNRA